MTTPEIQSLLPAARALLPEIVSIRRRIHRRPERGLNLPATQALIVDELQRLGLDATLGRATTSVAALIEGGAGPGPTVLLRADMDALPLSEDTGLDFSLRGRRARCTPAATTPTSRCSLGAAHLLVERRDRVRGPGPADVPARRGGLRRRAVMLDEGLLERPPGRSCRAGAFALHISTEYPLATINIRPGPMMAAADFLKIEVRGRGGHASQPSAALDPITVAAEIVLALQTMVTRRVEVFDPAVVTIAHLTAGTTNNIIPESAFLEGTIRTFSEGTRSRVHEGIRRLARGIAEAHGATAEVELIAGLPGDHQRSGLLRAGPLHGRRAAGRRPCRPRSIR